MAGFLTRLTAFCVLIDMLVAIVGVHLKNGFLGEGNYQFPLALAAIAFALIFFGWGPIAVDWLWGGKGQKIIPALVARNAPPRQNQLERGTDFSDPSSLVV